MQSTQMWPALALAVALHAQTALAQPGLAELERAFWHCDRQAQTGLVDIGTAADCSRSFEALKARKFDGNFTAMLAWWRVNKPNPEPGDESVRRRPSRGARSVNQP
ncbi:MAG: hypothetical protein V4792_01750 [Pseudomonadota bacterium]